MWVFSEKEEREREHKKMIPLVNCSCGKHLQITKETENANAIQRSQEDILVVFLSHESSDMSCP